jgi:hypothetical protein
MMVKVPGETSSIQGKKEKSTRYVIILLRIA